MGRRRREPPKLIRKIGRRAPKIRITIVCEGRLTEPSYFSDLARHCGALVSVDLVMEKGAGVPLSVVNKAIDLLPPRDRTAEDFERDDQVWVVFDRDAHPRFIEAVRKAEDAGIFVAYSNPCFELWLVLHYRDNDGPATRHGIQKALRALMPGYDPKRNKAVFFNQICNCLDDAEVRAEVLERRRHEEGNPRGNPSTAVFKLTREIRKHSTR
jgi:hypothetical protein